MELVFICLLGALVLGLSIYGVARITSDVDPNVRYLRKIPRGVYDGDYVDLGGYLKPDFGGLRDQGTWD